MTDSARPSDSMLLEAGRGRRPMFADPSLNTEQCYEVQSGAYPIFPTDKDKGSFAHLPSKIPPAGIQVYKKIRGKFYAHRPKVNGRLDNRFFDASDFSINDARDIFGVGKYKAVLWTDEPEPRKIWERLFEVKEGDTKPFECEMGLVDEQGAQVVEPESANNPSEETTSVQSGASVFQSILRKREEERAGPMGHGTEGRLSARLFADDQEPAQPDVGFQPQQPQSPGIQSRFAGRRLAPVRPVQPYEPPPEEDEEPAWAQSLFGELDELKEKLTRQPEPPKENGLVKVAEVMAPIVGPLLMSYLESAKRREEEREKDRAEERRRERAAEEAKLQLMRDEMEARRKAQEDAEIRRLEMMREIAKEREASAEKERKFYEEMRRKDEEARAERDRIRREEERKEEARLEERREARKKEEEARLDALKREEAKERAEQNKLTLHLEELRLKEDRAKTDALLGAGKIHPDVAKLMKKLEDERASAVTSGDPLESVIASVQKFKEVREKLQEVGLIDSPKEESGGIEGFIGKVASQFPEEKLANIITAVGRAAGMLPSPEDEEDKAMEVDLNAQLPSPQGQPQ